MSVKQFVSKNLAVIVIVPLLAGSHYGWYKLQQMDELVPPEQRKPLPFATFFQNMFSVKEVKALITKKE